MEAPLLTKEGTPSDQSQRAVSLGHKTLAEI